MLHHQTAGFYTNSTETAGGHFPVHPTDKHVESSIFLYSPLVFPARGVRVEQKTQNVCMSAQIYTIGMLSFWDQDSTNIFMLLVFTSGRSKVFN
jgi:hypothetical protein